MAMTVGDAVQIAKELSSPIVVALLLVAALIFRSEVKILVNWIVGFKRIAKTKEGYAVDAGAPAEPAPVEESKLEDKKLAEIEKESPPSSSEQTAGEAKETWWIPFFRKDYDEAIRMLEKEIS